MTQNKIELMAPVGSFESLHAAIQAGANSVYFGIEQLNMRARSIANFTTDDLAEITAICRQHDVKSYLTLNTILYDHDINLMKSIVDTAKENNVDAVIASDYAVLNYAKQQGVEIHISTQANVSNIDTVEFFAAFADVVVLARELSLMQVAAITRDIKRRNITGPAGRLVQVEMFAHGALCMAVSGKCYLSLHSDFASANRGACIQNCRRSYIVKDKENEVEFEVDNEYIMSAKDLCTIDFLDEMLKAGVSVLKIEGRGRSADYVFTTISCYREAIDAYLDGSYTREKAIAWKERLATVFNRGFWDGYYLGRKMGEWSEVYGSKATKKKIYIGKGVKYFEKAGAAEFKMEAQTLEPGNEILITGPTTGVVQTTVTEIRVNNLSAAIAVKGDTISIALEHKIRASDKLYKIVDA